MNTVRMKNTPIAALMTALDIAILEVSFFLGSYLRVNSPIHNLTPEYAEAYQAVAFVLPFIGLFVSILLSSYESFLSRGYGKEIAQVLAQVGVCLLIEAAFLFLSGYARIVSRLAYLYIALLCTLGTYLERCILKRLGRRAAQANRRTLLIFTTREAAERTIESVRTDLDASFQIIGLILSDTDACVGDTIDGVEVVSTLTQASEYMQTLWIDDALVDIPYTRGMGGGDAEEGQAERLRQTNGVLALCHEMGITSHQRLEGIDSSLGTPVVEELAGTAVLTRSLRTVTFRQLFFKRLIDIVGSLVGLALTAVLTIVVAPLIMIASPGSPFFAQTRVGKNGRQFRMYKFRSMYPDAEERKRELEQRNKMAGAMFKVDADPRIIGSGLDGTRHGIGWFIRRYSIDEFPQFLNVLKGDMSLVGTRPPTVEEWNAYERPPRARLSMKPGITGLWQVSGRSDITDFEEVVRLDMRYIETWSLTEDFKIIAKTIGVVFKGSGAE